MIVLIRVGMSWRRSQLTLAKSRGIHITTGSLWKRHHFTPPKSLGFSIQLHGPQLEKGGVPTPDLGWDPSPSWGSSSILSFFFMKEGRMDPSPLRCSRHVLMQAYLAPVLMGRCPACYPSLQNRPDSKDQLISKVWRSMRTTLIIWIRCVAAESDGKQARWRPSRTEFGHSCPNGRRPGKIQDVLAGLRNSLRKSWVKYLEGEESLGLSAKSAAPMDGRTGYIKMFAFFFFFYLILQITWPIYQF